MLPEGSNKLVVCKYNRIDKSDYFGLLMTLPEIKYCTGTLVEGFKDKKVHHILKPIPSTGKNPISSKVYYLRFLYFNSNVRLPSHI